MASTGNGEGPERPTGGFPRRALFAGAAAVGAVALTITEFSRGAPSGATAAPAAELGNAGSRREMGARLRLAGAEQGGSRIPSVSSDPPIQPFRDALRIPSLLRPRGNRGAGHLTIPMESAKITLHSQLPPTPLWTYNGEFPGPTIEVRRGEKTSISWANGLSGTCPAIAALPALIQEEDAVQPWDIVGRDGAPPLPEVAALRPWTAVHLHGATTGGNNDGWAENGGAPGETQLAEYLNNQRACALWYHDHGMHVTRINTMAGLAAGFYLIRDDEEDALELPSGDREIPLVLFDRNFETDGAGRITGQVLYKQVLMIPADRNPAGVDLVRTSTAPFVLTNGVVWPYLDVRPECYRFRVLNASEGRQYQLRIFDEAGNALPDGTILQIGTDSGLLGQPIPIEGDLIVSPAERADVLIDFSGYAGKTLTVMNNIPVEPGPWPYIMQFRVQDGPAEKPFRVPMKLSPTFSRVDPERIDFAAERFVAVVPTFPQGPGYWELEPVESLPGEAPVDGYIQVRRADGSLLTLRRVASRFDDALNFTGTLGTWEKWNFFSLELGGGIPHPIHLHAFPFQLLGIEQYDVEGFEYFATPGGGYGGGTRTPVTHVETVRALDNELGWKDVVRLPDQHMITLAVHLEGATGRFMHHCHNYNHEDHRMMRPFVVMPADVMALDPARHQSPQAEKHHH